VLVELHNAVSYTSANRGLHYSPMKNGIVKHCFSAIAIGVALTACQPSCPDADLAFNRGQNAFIQGRYELARTYFSEDLQLNPGRSESLKQLGVAWLEGSNGVLSNALDTFDQYLAINPDDIRVKIRRVKSLQTAGEWSRLEKLDELLGDSLEELLVKAEVMTEQGNHNALAMTQKALTIDPDNTLGHEIAALIYQRGKSLQHAQQSISNGAFTIRPYYIATQAATRLQKRELATLAATQYEAVEILRRSDRHPNIPAKKLRTALTNFEVATPQAQDFPEFVAFKIGLLFKIGDRQAALEVFNASPWQQIFSQAQLLTMATAAVNAQAHAMAQQIYQHVSDTDSGKETVYLGLARIALQNSNYTLLEQHASAALNDQCWIAGHHYYLAQVDIHSQADDMAVAHLTKAVKLAPWRTDWRLLLVNLHLSLGQTAVANQVLDEAPTAEPAIEQFRRQHGLY